MITTVAVITRLRIHQELLSNAIGSRPGFAVIAIAADEDDAIDAIAQRPEVVLLDAALPRVWHVTQVARHSGAAVALFGVTDRPEPVTQAERAGCDAVLVTSATTREVIDALERIRSHTGHPLQPPVDPTPVATLTSRELEVLALIAKGLSNKEIATELTVSLPTVKTHVHNVLYKLGARRRADAGRLLHLAATGTAAGPGVTERRAAAPTPA
jgi:DNA-binding NarL/FixJ family response regulator